MTIQPKPAKTTWQPPSRINPSARKGIQNPLRTRRPVKGIIDTARLGIEATPRFKLQDFTITKGQLIKNTPQEVVYFGPKAKRACDYLNRVLS